jgi:hypothetical protein
MASTGRRKKTGKWHERDSTFIQTSNFLLQTHINRLIALIVRNVNVYVYDY